jgi:SNF family Na+-dependent transporter
MQGSAKAHGVKVRWAFASVSRRAGGAPVVRRVRVAPQGARVTEPKEQWGTRLGVILAVAGSAVGLGNFLRFPGQASQNGGGAFMVPYFCALILLGIPIGWAEWTMARRAGLAGFHSAPGVMGVIGRGAVARYFGVIGVLVPLVVFFYYVLIESWCLAYCLGYFTGFVDLGDDPAGYADKAKHLFVGVTGSDMNGVTLRGEIHPSVLVWLAVFAINFMILRRGISKGIEKFCAWAMPLMAVCAVVVLIRVLTLGTPDAAQPDRSVINGLGFMWNPDFSKLGEFKTWLAAAGQIFFSLSVGFGVIINYATYLRRKDDVVLSGLTASATNELFEVGFGGLITIPAAFVFLGASGAIGGTFGLGFNTLPVVFEYMGPLGRVVGAVWFFMLFLAAITSSLSMLQPVMAFFEEALGMPRKRSVPLLGVVTFLGSSWCVWFSKDLTALDTMDFWVGTVLIFVLAAVQIICFGWVWGVDRGLAHAHEGAHLRIPSVFRFIMKYVAPAYLIVVFVGFCVQNLPDYVKGLAGNDVARWTLLVVAVVLAGLLWVTRQGEKRWRIEGRDLDGKRLFEGTP